MRCSTNINNNDYEDIFMAWKNIYDIMLNKRQKSKLDIQLGFNFIKQGV